MNLNHFRAGTGEPLVLIHGIGSRWEMWQPVLPLLLAERDVIAVDLPGFGASPMPPPGTPAGVPTLTRLVGEFLDSLGLDRPHLAGNSLGGWISFELAKQGRARSATGLSPAGFYTNPREAKYGRANLWASRRAAQAAAPLADRLFRSPTARTVAFGHLAARPARMPPGDAVLHLQGLASAPWFDETLRAITMERFEGGEPIAVSVTIAWGERDRLLLPRQAHRAAQAIPSARVVTLTGCGHVPTYDDPEQVARVLLEGSSGG